MYCIIMKMCMACNACVWCIQMYVLYTPICSCLPGFYALPSCLQSSSSILNAKLQLSFHVFVLCFICTVPFRLPSFHFLTNLSNSLRAAFPSRSSKKIPFFLLNFYFFDCSFDRMFDYLFMS